MFFVVVGGVFPSPGSEAAASFSSSTVSSDTVTRAPVPGIRLGSGSWRGTRLRVGSHDAPIGAEPGSFCWFLDGLMQRGKTRGRVHLATASWASRASVAAIRTASTSPVSVEDFPLWNELNLPSRRRLSQLICLLLCFFEKIRLRRLSNPVARRHQSWSVGASVTS